jgi:hypothetical protein
MFNSLGYDALYQPRVISLDSHGNELDNNGDVMRRRQKVKEKGEEEEGEVIENSQIRSPLLNFR